MLRLFYIDLNYEVPTYFEKLTVIKRLPTD